MSAELIRVAILWHELWHEGLEEASRLYFTEKNPEAMIAVLEPLHDLLEAVRPICRCSDTCPALNYSFGRAQQRLAKLHSPKYLVGNFKMLVDIPVGSGPMER